MHYYIKIFDSPRSKSLPEMYSATTIDVTLENQSLFAIYKIKNLRSVWLKLREIRGADVWIEYSGNLFSNVIILLFLSILKNSITLDCHNSAIEPTKGKRLRYIISLTYIKFLQVVCRFEIVVHNSAVARTLRSANVIYTPFPKLRDVNKKNDQNDILFLCSLNADEPMALIFELCLQLRELGYRVCISGDPEKATMVELKEFMFGRYISYDEYLVEVKSSKLTVCLTERSETLLYAPREAIVLGVNCLINDSCTNRDYYQNRVFYSSLDYNNLLNNIQSILGDV